MNKTQQLISDTTKDCYILLKSTLESEALHVLKGRLLFSVLLQTNLFVLQWGLHTVQMLS